MGAGSGRTPRNNLLVMIRFLLLCVQNLPKLLFGRGPSVIRSGGLEFVLRPRTLDILILREIQLVKMYTSRLAGAPLTADVVVDLGANFGAFAVWAYATLKPKRLILVEPWQPNLKILSMNAQHCGFENIAEIIPAAVYQESGPVGFRPRPRASANSAIDEHSHLQVAALTFRDLLDKHHIKTLDYLKIDIEGGERFILSEENRNVFSERVRYVIMEIHCTHMPIEQALTYFERLGFESYKWDPKEWGANTRMLEARNPNL